MLDEQQIYDLIMTYGPKVSRGRPIRQIIADSKVKDFTPLYRTLYDEVDSYADGKVGHTILNIAEGQYKDSMVVDKEINVMAMILTILMTLGK